MKSKILIILAVLWLILDFLFGICYACIAKNMVCDTFTGEPCCTFFDGLLIFISLGLPAWILLLINNFLKLREIKAKKKAKHKK